MRENLGVKAGSGLVTQHDQRQQESDLTLDGYLSRVPKYTGKGMQKKLTLQF